jgi:hypothetical protein
MKTLLQMRAGSALLLGSALITSALSFAQSNPPAEPAHSAASLPQDSHEGLKVSADPFSDPGRAKDKFGKADPVPLGILPVEVFLTNETPVPLRLNMETIQLNVQFDNGRHQDVDWLAVQEVARAIAHPKGPSNPHAPRIPIGVNTGADTKTDKMIDILKPFVLDADVIPPLGTIHGFLFFDLDHDMTLANHCSLYVPDVTNISTKKPLMFFEVDLSK